MHNADNALISAVREDPGSYAGEGEFKGAVHSNALLLVKAKIFRGGHNPHRVSGFVDETDAFAAINGYRLRHETFIHKIHDANVLPVFKHTDRGGGNGRSDIRGGGSLACRNLNLRCSRDRFRNEGVLVVIGVVIYRNSLGSFLFQTEKAAASTTSAESRESSL